MRVFADHCVSTDAVVGLRLLGIPVQRAYEVGLERAEDEVLFAHAQQTGQVLLSFDQDFGNIVRFDVTHSLGIVIVEVERFSKNHLLRRLQEFFRDTPERTVRGRLHVLKPGRTRVWPKPKPRG